MLYKIIIDRERDKRCFTVIYYEIGVPFLKVFSRFWANKLGQGRNKRVTVPTSESYNHVELINLFCTRLESEVRKIRKMKRKVFTRESKKRGQS